MPSHPPLEGALDLEQWMRTALAAGQSDLVIKLLKTIPEGKREKYREIWKKIMEDKAGGK